MLAFFAFELQTERFFQSCAYCIEGRQFCFLNPCLRVARIRGEKPCDIFRLRQRRSMQHQALDVFNESIAEPSRRSARTSGDLPKVGLIRSDGKALALYQI